MTSTPYTCFMGHRLGRDPVLRPLNVERAARWAKFLIDHTDWVISAPWFLYASCLPEDPYRPRSIRDGMTQMRHAHFGVIVGPERTAGCTAEVQALLDQESGVLDLTPMGRADPPTPDARWAHFFKRWEEDLVQGYYVAARTGALSDEPCATIEVWR